MDGPGFETGQDYEFLLQKRPDRLWRQYSFLFGGYRFFPPRIQRSGHKVDNSLSYNAEVKSEWSYTSASPIHAFMSWTGATLSSFSLFIRRLFMF